eukprot:gene13299-biopygen14084
MVILTFARIRITLPTTCLPTDSPALSGARALLPPPPQEETTLSASGSPSGRMRTKCMNGSSLGVVCLGLQIPASQDPSLYPYSSCENTRVVSAASPGKAQCCNPNH